MAQLDMTNMTIKNDVITDYSKNAYRNALCWCGSGKKIKKCSCLEAHLKERKKVTSDTLHKILEKSEILVEKE